MDKRPQQVRLVDKNDAATVASFGPAHGEPLDGARWRRTVVAEVGDAVVGAGSLGQNTMHRQAYWLEIDVEESAGGLPALGPPIYDRLRRLRPESWPVWWRAMASRPERLEFAQRAGFEVVVRAPVPRLDPTSAEVQRWIAEHEVAPVAEVHSAERCTTDDLLDAWASYYVWAHASWFPVISIDVVRESLATGLIRGLDRSLTTIAIRHGRIAALAQVFPDVWDGQTSLMCAETVHRDEPDGQALVGAVIAASLRRLAASGRTTLDFEGHDIDPHYGPLATTLPAIGTDPLILLKAE